MRRTISIDTTQHIGESVSVSGWVHARRDHGGLIFIDVRDHGGIVQLVIQPDTPESFSVAENVRDEYVVTATGVVKERAEGLENDHIATGRIEIVVSELRILNKSDVLPIPIHSEETQANEELRLRYRFLDLRREKMQHMLRSRAKYYQLIRSFMDNQDFVEVTTPILANSSPEGARDFLVPSRVHSGKFYALPQAPQQFKQLLMVGGLPRYYQIATCFRDEDPRADRLYGDFYQLDLEMSFVEDGEVVRSTTEPLIKQLVKEFAQKELVSEEIPRIPYQVAIEQYGTDKPDLRFDMQMVDLTDALSHTEFGVFKHAIDAGGAVKAICAPDASSFSRAQLDTLTEIAKKEGAGGLAYIVYESDGGVRSPIAKFLSTDELDAIASRTGAKPGDIVLFGADQRAVVNKVLGRLRDECASLLDLKDPNKIALAWIVDFPFYEWDEANKKLDFGHNPFSMPKGGIEALKNEDKLSILADQYDMVMNGYEICSGAVRNHNPEVMYGVFDALGYDASYVDSRFGAMINAFKYGAPPHAGCAYGIDRMFMVLTGEDNIREVVAFPKNGSGVDVMMNSPSVVDQSQLDELSIRQVNTK